MLEKISNYLNSPAPPGSAIIAVGLAAILIGLFVIFFTSSKK